MTSQQLAALSAPSISAYGTAANPQAGVAIATLTTPAAGAYEITVDVILTGTIAAGDLNNFIVKKGATTVKQILVNPTTASVGKGVVKVALDGATSVTVAALANASGASAVYSTSLTAVKVA